MRTESSFVAAFFGLPDLKSVVVLFRVPVSMFAD